MIYKIDIYTIASLFGIVAITVNRDVFSQHSFIEVYGEDFTFMAETGARTITCELDKAQNRFGIIELEEDFDAFELTFCKVE